jgi:quercetin dioxygenase-like cupin family protein
VFKRNAEAKLVEMFPGVTRRTLNSGDRTTLVEIAIAKGASVPLHTHPHEQIGYVARGRLRFQIGDDVRDLAMGDSYCVPGEVSHGVEALEDAIAVDIFSPVRDEYLD